MGVGDAEACRVLEEQLNDNGDDETDGRKGAKDEAGWDHHRKQSG